MIKTFQFQINVDLMSIKQYTIVQHTNIHGEFNANVMLANIWSITVIDCIAHREMMMQVIVTILHTVECLMFAALCRMKGMTHEYILWITPQMTRLYVSRIIYFISTYWSGIKTYVLNVCVVKYRQHNWRCSVIHLIRGKDL